jgi:hypothetical protein
VEPWPVVDDLIFDGKTLLAIKTIRGELGGDLRQAILTYHDRAAMLWATCPEEFAPAWVQQRGTATDPAEPGSARLVAAS